MGQNEEKCPKVICRVDLPYPEVDGVKPNRRYADILSYDYAGYISETTAILQYAYQSYILKNVDACISKTMLDIAIVEMEHHELLAETIIALGGDPIIANARRQYWSGQFVDYVKGTRRILLANIDSEMKAIEGYRRAIMMIEDVQIRALLERIILDEKLHIEIFEKMLSEVTNWG